MTFHRMKKILSLTVAASLFLVSGASSAIVNLQTTFNDAFRGGNPADVVGIGTFSYEAPSALANGSYLLSSFVNPVFNFSFNNGATFTMADLYNTPAEQAFLGVDIADGQFNFYRTGSYTQANTGGSAVFVNSADNWLAFSPNDAGQDFGSGFGRAGFFVTVDGPFQDPANVSYAGSYGIGSSPDPGPAAVPEPGTWAAAALLAGGAAFMRWRKRRDEAQRMEAA